MSIAKELADLFRRDITRLGQEVKAFPDDSTLWVTLPGTTNSAGNLALHLEGNLREYIGRQLGGVPYERRRPLEFSSKGVTREELAGRVTALQAVIPDIVLGLTDQALDAPFPEEVLGLPLSTRQFVIHLLGHLNYHLGQIDYLRRIVTEGTAIPLAGL